MITTLPGRGGGKAALLAVTCAAVLLFATAPAASAKPGFYPPVVYHIVSATVNTKWEYSDTGHDIGGNPFSGNGGETANLTFARAIGRTFDRFGIYTAQFNGSFTGDYFFGGNGITYACPSYAMNPAAVKEQLQLVLVTLPRHRVEVNAGLGPGQTRAATSAFSQQLVQVGETCGQMPPRVGQALDYSPAPNNVHTSACEGIAHGCEIFQAAAFRRNRVVVHIAVNDDPVSSAYSAIPEVAAGRDVFSWSIDVVLQRAHGRR